MKKSTFIILISSLFVIVIALSIFVLLKGQNDEKNKKSEELIAAEELFDIKKNADGTEYYIYRLNSNKNINGSTIVIPDTIDNIPVTKIIDKTNDFASFNKVSVIKLGKNINYIGKSAYSVGENTKYGENIFLQASSLVSIDVKEGNETYSSVDGVLYNKDQTVLIKYPTSKNKKADLAIHSYTILNTVEIIYQNAFKYNKFIEVLNVCDSVKYIESGAFYTMESLYSIKLGKGILEIGKEAFTNCDNLDKIELPESLKKINSSAFSRCDKLTSIYFKSNILFLGVNLFSGSNSLKDVYVKNEYYDNLVLKFSEADLDSSIIKTQN